MNEARCQAYPLEHGVLAKTAPGEGTGRRQKVSVLEPLTIAVVRALTLRVAQLKAFAAPGSPRAL